MPIDELMLGLIHLQDALGGHYGRLSRPKLRLMVKLIHGPASVSELAQRLHISSPAVSQMIDKLAEEQLVERVAMGGDQRVVGIHLTEVGDYALAEALQAFRHRVDDVLAPLTADQRALFQSLLLTLGEVTS